MATRKARNPVVSAVFILCVPVLALLFSVLFSCGQACALTSRDLIRLKKAGVPENLIILMLDSGYGNADEVIALEKAGFSAETIQAFILANRSKKGNIVYSTKGLEDQNQTPCPQLCPPYWQDMPPYTGLFISPKTNGKGNGGRGAGSGQSNAPAAR